MGTLLGIAASSAVILTCCWMAVGMIQADAARLLTLEEVLWVMDDSDSGSGVTLYPPGSGGARQIVGWIRMSELPEMRFSGPIVYSHAMNLNPMGTATCVLVSPKDGCVSEYGHQLVAPIRSR